MPECAKFKLTDHTKTINGATVYQIQSLKQFYTIDGNTVLYGQMGGFVSDPEILSQYDKSWVGGNACVVYGKIKGNALVKDNAYLFDTDVSDDVIIGKNAVCRGSTISGKATITGNADLKDVLATGHAYVTDDAMVRGDNAFSYLGGDTCICGNAFVKNSSLTDAYVGEKSTVTESDIRGYDVCKSSYLEYVTLVGKSGNVSNSILQDVWVYAPCRFRDAHITKQDEFWFMIAHSEGLSYIALYPNRDGKIVVVYHGSGYPETVSVDEFDKIIERKKYMPLKRWRAIKDIALASIQGSRKE